MRPRPRPTRAAPIGSPEAIAEYHRWREQFEREALRKVRAWARTWEGCPLAGCRRNNRCLREDACRGVPEELTEEHLRLIREAFAETRAQLKSE
jgi:hypothetical protein